MSKVILELSISLDGFVTGPDVSAEVPMGCGGEGLHEWMFAGKSEAESEAFETAHHREHGALIMGRRMVDLGIGSWEDPPPFYAPCFVVTHRPTETIVKKGGTSYIVVTDGIEAALERARQAAGSQDVQVNGGADIARQFLNRGLLDEIRLHLVPIILGRAPACSMAWATTFGSSCGKRSTRLESRTWSMTSAAEALGRQRSGLPAARWALTLRS